MKRRTNFDGRRLPRNDLAVCGYWATPVQKVVESELREKRRTIAEALRRKYRGNPRAQAEKLERRIKSTEKRLQSYQAECFYSVFYGDELRVTLKAKLDKGYVIRLLAALHEVWSSRDKPAYWLLELGSTGGGAVPAPDEIPTYPAYSYEELQAEIIRQGGPTFSQAALAKAASKLRLTQ